MPFAVTHVIGAILLIDLFRIHVLKKQNFPLYLVLIGGIAGLLPDLDIPVYWVLQSFFDLTINEVHKLYSHNLIIPLAILLLALVSWKWKKVSQVFLVIAAGYTIHIILDTIFYIAPLFYPFSNAMFGLNLLQYIPIADTFYIGMDAIILVIWLAYEWKYKKIRDYV